ncbi:nucleotide excision repair protein, partial [Escherichia coli]|nr:nucleotide excision repair protein [Escherichia coli]EFW7022672.1 nucleotide excision repair protein [Shigella sonnei]EJJ3523554.1 nucleotide excision repair protein [Salmonella enterica subsp. enterica serovar London]EET4009987.1 nucleotide excision repair protein [Escherichia coli]EET5257434.1 nucleotide excision repair protein [Escherichia coli]
MDKCQLIDIPSDPEKKREWIKYKLKIQGLSLAALGRKHKTSR